MFIIYCHTNKVTSRSYVGYTSETLEERWRGHVWSAKRGDPWLFARAIRVYGEEVWEHRVLRECETLQEAHDAERFFIKELNTKKPNGYNLTDGGEGFRGLEFTSQHRQHLSEARLGWSPSAETRSLWSKQRRGVAHPHKGGKQTEASNLKRSVALRGKPQRCGMCHQLGHKRNHCSEKTNG